MGVPISNVTRRVVYAASGTGPYAFTFEILANTDIAVYRDDTLLTLTTDYTVSIASNGTGSITLVAAPTGADQIAIVGNRTIQRTTDFVTGGDFFANTVNDEMDQQTIFAQQNAEGLLRALTAPQTDPTNINMVLPRASIRANKTLAFDSSGNPTTGEIIGDYRGNWASGTAYNKRDLIKDTSNSNIYYCNTAHTASGSQPISSNADSGKWTLIIDAAAAGESANDAATSATAAASSATAAASSATAAASSATAASGSASTASTQASNASTSATAAASSASTASTQATNAGTSATAAASSATSAASSATSASSSATTAQNWASKTDGAVSGGEYSSKYWAQQAAGAVAAGVIDDATVSTSKTWSSDKLTDALKNGAQVTDYGAVGDGTTDDTTAVQAAITAGAKLIVFPAGKTFLIDQVTSAGTDTTFYAVGATIKLKANSTNYRPLRINHARCVVIGGTWDGNKANQSAGDAFSSWAIGLHADDCGVYDAIIKNFRGCGVKIYNASRCTVERCKITDIGYSTSAACYGIFADTVSGTDLYANKARNNYIALGNEGTLDQGILFNSTSHTGGEAQWDWEISGNTVMGSTNAGQGDGSICLAVRGHRGKVLGNTTVGGSMGWSEGGNNTVIQGNTFKGTVGTVSWGIEPSGYEMLVNDNIIVGHIRGICFSFADNDDMVIAGNTIVASEIGVAAEAPVSGTAANVTISGNRISAPKGVIATRDVKGLLISGNAFVGPGSGTANSRAVKFDTPTSTAINAKIDGNRIMGVERAVEVYSASATTYTDVAFTNNFCRDDVAGGIYAHVAATGSAVLGARIKNFGNEQNSSTDNFNMLFDQTNKRGIEYSNSYATPEGNVTAGVGSIYVNLAGAAGTVLWIKESGTGNTGWGQPVTATGTQTLTNKTITTVSLRETKVAVAASAIDLATANYFSKTISGSTTFTVSNVPSTGTAASFILDLTNGGSATVTWWSGVKWAGGTAPTLTSAGRDVLGFFTHDGGTTWSGLVLGKDVK